MEAGSLSTYLFTQGVLGVACLVLGAVVIYQNKKIDRRDERIQQLQDLRLADQKEVTKEVTSVVENNSQSIRVLSEKIEIAKQKRS